MAFSTACIRRIGALVALVALAFIIPVPRLQAQTIDSLGGTHYVVAFPDTTRNTTDPRFPNVRYADRVYILVYSSVTTGVTITGNGYTKTFAQPGGVFTAVNLLDPPTAPSPIVDRSGQVSRNTFTVRSDEPILLYCYLVTKYGAEAWTPLPVARWGTQYYAAAMPGERANDVSPGGEFDYRKKTIAAPSEILVIAAEDNTRITIIPNGELHGFPAVTNVLLNAGEAYQVQSYVDTISNNEGAPQPDLGGSTIMSTKPVGVVTGNTRAQIVDQDMGLAKNSFKNMLIEWLPPSESHGRRFVYMTPWDAHRMNGNLTDTNSDRRPVDVVRIYGTAPGLTSGFYVQPDGSVVNFTVPLRGVYEARFPTSGARYFQTDKPAQAMMASAAAVKFNGTTVGFGNYIGAQFDAWGGHMSEMTPRERWVSFAPYYIPNHPAGMEHFINVVTDSLSARSVVDETGAPFAFPYRVAGTDLVWGVRSITPGATHTLRGLAGAKFHGFVYGVYKGHEEYRPGKTRKDGGDDPTTLSDRGESDGALMHPSEYEEYLAVAYSYPLVSIGHTDTSDTPLPPPDSVRIDTTTSECGSRMTVTVRLVNVNPAGLHSITLDRATNTRITYVSPANPLQLSGATVATVTVEASDIHSDAYAKATIVDKSGTPHVVEFKYTAEQVSFLPSNGLDFGSSVIGDEATKTITISNPMSRDAIVRDVRLRYGNRDYTIDQVSVPLPVTLAPNEQISVRVGFSATLPYKPYDDTLEVLLDCITYEYPVTADVVAGVDDVDLTGYSLAGNHPNPFTRRTEISFSLGKGGQTTIVLYNSAGERIATLLDRRLEAGDQTVTWEPTSLTPGTYYYRVVSGDWSATGSMTVR